VELLEAALHRSAGPAGQASVRSAPGRGTEVSLCWAAIAIAVAAVAVIDRNHRSRGTMGGIDLAVLGTGWLLVPVVISSPALVWLTAALLLLGVHAALVIHAGGLNPVVLSQLGGAAYIVAALLILFTVVRPALAARAALAARQAAMASRSAAEGAAADAIEQEGRARLAALERKALPLLRAVADGTLDPADETVRARCAGHAAALRQSIDGSAPGEWRPPPRKPAGRPADGDLPGADGEAGPGGQPAAAGLAAALGPALRAAAAREPPVTVQLIGDPGTPVPPVAQAVGAAVGAVLSGLPPHQVLLTVLAAGDDVELYLTFGAPLTAVPDLSGLAAAVPAGVRWHAVVSAADDGGGCLEISWRRGGTG
jgi:hypothetical protein